MTGYPWETGDALLASDLNAAIASAGGQANTVNVLDHGMKMDGVTDDYAALQAVINTVGAGSVLYFPPSPTSLLLSRSVGIGSGQTWWAYPGTVTIAPTAGNVDTVLLLGTANTSNVTVHGLTFDGGGQDFASPNAVTQAYHVSGMTLDRVTFRNTRGIAFNGSGVNDLAVRDCMFQNIGNHWKTTNNTSDTAQALTNGSGDNANWGFRMEVSGCSFSDCGGDCINLGAIQDVRIIDNGFTQVLTPWASVSSTAWFSAIFPLFCTNVVIVGNVMRGMTGNAIDGAAMWKGVISGNTIRDSGGAALGLFDGSGYPSYGAARGSRDVSITGNHIENSGNWITSPFRNGIQLADSAVGAVNVRVANNISTDTRSSGKTQQYGISYSGPGSSGIWVDPSNMLAGNAVGPKNGVAPTAVTGAKAGNAALASLITTLAGFGLITDSTS